MPLNLHSDDIKIEQKADIPLDPDLYDGDIVIAEKIDNKAYLDELAFTEEPVTIRLEPSAERNAATVFPVWVNGKMAEVFQNGRWKEVGYLPVGVELIVKRKVLGVIITAKVDAVQVHILNPESERPNNVVTRFTSPVHSFSIIEDRNPAGAAWVTELRRRNY